MFSHALPHYSLRVGMLIGLAYLAWGCAPVRAAAPTPVPTSTPSDVLLTRIAEDRVRVGQETLVTLALENTASSARKVVLTEILPAGVDAPAATATGSYVRRTKRWTLTWTFTLPPHSATTVAYRLALRDIGPVLFNASTLRIGTRRATALPNFTMVSLCRANGSCDAAAGEDIVSCPADCAPPPTPTPTPLPVVPHEVDGGRSSGMAALLGALGGAGVVLALLWGATRMWKGRNAQ